MSSKRLNKRMKKLVKRLDEYVPLNGNPIVAPKGPFNSGRPSVEHFGQAVNAFKDRMHQYAKDMSSDEFIGRYVGPWGGNEAGSGAYPKKVESKSKEDDTPTEVANNLINKINNLPPGDYVLTSVNNVIDVRLEGQYIKTTEILYGNIAKRVKRYFNRFCKRDNSLGVMLVGNKGSGKTLEGEVLGNVAIRNGLPVIRVVGLTVNDKIINILYGLDNVVLLLDEFKKHFPPRVQEKMLSLLTNRSKKMMFIITENDINHINYFMKDRPERLFYRREFKKIELDALKDYLLDYPAHDLVIDKMSIDGVIIPISEVEASKVPYMAFKSNEMISVKHKVTNITYNFNLSTKVDEYSDDTKVIMVARQNGVNVGVVYKYDRTFEEAIIEAHKRALTFSMDQLMSIIDEHYLYPEDTLDEMLDIINVDSLKSKVILTIRSVDKIIREPNSKEVTYEPMKVLLDKCEEVPLSNFNKGYGHSIYVMPIPKETEEGKDTEEIKQPGPPMGRGMGFNNMGRPGEERIFFNQADLVSTEGISKVVIAKNYRIILEELAVKY